MLDELAGAAHTCTYYEPTGEPCPRCEALAALVEHVFKKRATGATLKRRQIQDIVNSLDIYDNFCLTTYLQKRSQSNGGNPTQ